MKPLDHSDGPRIQGLAEAARLRCCKCHKITVFVAAWVDLVCLKPDITEIVGAQPDDIDPMFYCYTCEDHTKVYED